MKKIIYILAGVIALGVIGNLLNPRKKESKKEDKIIKSDVTKETNIIQPNIDEVEWLSEFESAEVNGSWFEIVNFEESNSYNKNYFEDGNNEQKKMTITNKTYQTSYPFGTGDNPVFGCKTENGYLIVSTIGEISSEIYKYKVELSQDKKLLKLTLDGLIQVFKRK